MKTKKNEKTYAVSKDTFFFLTKLCRFITSAYLKEEYPCFRDKEFTKKMADLFLEECVDLFYGVLIGHYGKFRFSVLKILPYVEQCPWLYWTIYSRGILGIGAGLKKDRDIYEGYQKICRYFDGMFTVENKRDIMEIELTGDDMMTFHGAWFLLKKYAD
ncbi:MAG: hypothetical protein IKB70_08975 [Bacilli bacterium]|nr:hypothetical protein [Bacilli bacterium]